MKTLKKSIAILILALVLLAVLTTTVSAGAVSIKASASKVTVGKNVSVTVSFGEKVSAAQFKLNYDTSKFDYVSCSAGSYGTGTKTYVYVNYEDVADLGSVTFTFKSKAVGSGSFSISGVVLSGSSSIANGSTTVTVQKATTSTNKPSTTNKKPTSSTNKNDKEDEEPEIVIKTELDAIKAEVMNLVETDYTEESWKALQEAIARADGATKNEEYNEAKGALTLEGLVPVSFEKNELNKVLRSLIGKVEKDYTPESWVELQEAIDIADNATLKSEYESVKEKLTIDGLILEEQKGPLEEFVDRVKGQDPFVLGLAIAVIILFLMVVIVLILFVKEKNKSGLGRRLK